MNTVNVVSSSSQEHAERYIPQGYDPQLYKLRHSAAHIMAQAVIDLFQGDVRLAIGPPIEDRFYYDFDLPRPLTPDDLEQIERRMREIIAGNHPFQYREVSADEARDLFRNQPFKLELIEGLERGEQDENGSSIGEKPIISVYQQASFVDLCRGPHLVSTGDLNPDAFKLLSVAGAYWRGDERQPMLQRIYGTAWRIKAELDHYLWRIEEANRRDHRRLGRELDLFSTHEDIGSGLILWHPKGGMIRKLIEDHWGKLHEEAGYDFVYSPHIGKAKLWETSGHLDFYKELFALFQRSHVTTTCASATVKPHLLIAYYHKY